MKIAVLGGGMTGLTTAYYLTKKGYSIKIFEKEDFLGGMASGFKKNTWSWYLDKTYHHLFASDREIISLAEEINFDRIFFKSPETASLSWIEKTLRILPLDTPIDLLRFPKLNLVDKFRTGLVLGFLKLSPFLTVYEQYTSQGLLRKMMGEESWKILWQSLFRKKFGKYAGKIVASFIWARIKTRTKKLGYVKGGFQQIADYLGKLNQSQGVTIRKGVEIVKVNEVNDKRLKVVYQDKKGRQGKEIFDLVISTLPTPVLLKIGKDIFPQRYINQLEKINYLDAIVFIIETDKPVLKKTYWLNIGVKEFPFTVIVQHTNLVNKRYYGGNHLAYIGQYVDRDDRRLKMDKKEALHLYQPYLRRLNPDFKLIDYYLFKTPFAQPVLDKQFIINRPDFYTPVKNLFIANLDMTYPYERGTNYAVGLGKKMAEVLLKEVL